MLFQSYNERRNDLWKDENNFGFPDKIKTMNKMVNSDEQDTESLTV